MQVLESLRYMLIKYIFLLFSQARSRFYVHVRTSSSTSNAILALKCMRQSTHSKGFGDGIVGDDDIGN